MEKSLNGSVLTDGTDNMLDAVALLRRLIDLKFNQQGFFQTHNLLIIYD